MQKKFSLKQKHFIFFFSLISVHAHISTVSVVCLILTSLVQTVCHDRRHRLSTFNLMHLVT